MGVALESSDHSAPSQHGQRLDVIQYAIAPDEPIHLIGGSTGLSLSSTNTHAKVPIHS